MTYYERAGFLSHNVFSVKYLRIESWVGYPRTRASTPCPVAQLPVHFLGRTLKFASLLQPVATDRASGVSLG